MRTLSKKQTAVVSGVAAAALATSGVAYAYWTTGGSGTGQAGTSAGATSQLALIDADTVTPSGMAPGVAPGPISVVVKNTNLSTSYHVASVTVAIDSVDGGIGACDASDYTFLDTTSTPVAGTGSVVMTNGAADLTKDDGNDASGTDQSAFSGVKLGFNDKPGTNQDGCKGATVHLAFAIA